MNTKEIREYKKDLKFSEIQRSIIIGTLLGDGHLETQDGGRTYRLKIEHSIKQNDYTIWLHDHFKEWVPGGIYRKNKNDKEYVGFRTYSHGAFRFYGQLLYDKTGKKRIPKIIHKLLNDLSLAIWFMDDGSLKSLKHRTYIIHSLGFEKRELEAIKKCLLKSFDIESELHRQKGKYWRIYILSKSAEVFEKIIKKYVFQIPSMERKMVNKMPKK